MGYPPAEGFLLSAAVDESEEFVIRRKALESIGWFTSDESLSLLREMLSYPTDFNIRASAARGLGLMTGRYEALDALMLAVTDEKTNIVLTEIVRAMGKHGNPVAIPVIGEARSKHVRDTVCDTALRQIELLSSEMKGDMD
jgi:HEAT repeat protein